MAHQEDPEFEEFVHARWTALVRTGYLLTGDRGHAEDLAQIALAKAFASWGRVRRSDHPDAYVRRILVNAYLDRFRTRRIVELLTDRPPERAGHDDAERVAQRRTLMTCLARLPRRQRAVVVLRYWEDLPETEVAALLRCSVGSVKSQASRGLARLRRDAGLAALKEERQEDPAWV